MSVRWERFAGDTSTFAIRLAFHHDPDEGAGASPEMATSWGSFQIWVRGINLCSHVDQGETLQASHWYLLPLLEWLASNWDPLLHEERLPAGLRSPDNAAVVGEAAASSFMALMDDTQELAILEARYDWEQRHSIRVARAGGILPDVRIRRLRDEVEISWRNSQLAGVERVSFLSPEGLAYEDPLLVAEPLFEVLQNAAGWLAKQLPDSERCSVLVESVAALRQPERTEERSAWLAGLGTTREHIVERWQQLRESGRSLEGPNKAFGAVFDSNRSNKLVLPGSCQAALLFGSTDPEITDSDAMVLAKLLLDTYEQSPTDGLSALAFDEPIDPLSPPWQQGYDLAADLLDDVNDSLDGPTVDVEALFDDWNISLIETDLSDRRLRAVAFVGPGHAPSVVLNSNHLGAKSAQARRFTLAHELCHLLHDRSHGTQLAIASGPWAPQALEKRANAFAAWLLMPPSLLQTAIRESSSSPDTIEWVDEIASSLNVGRAALIEHLFNLGHIDEETRDDLRSPIVN